MANIAAVKSGNWSDPTVWSGGVLPGVNDLALSAYTVTIDQDITVQGLYAVSGGSSSAFVVTGTANRTITLTSTGLIAVGYNHTTLVITSSGITNLTTPLGVAGSNYQLLYIAGLNGGTVNLTIPNTPSYSISYGQCIVVSGTNYTVNVTCGDIIANSNTGRVCDIGGTSNTVNWVGNIYGANAAADGALLLSSATSTLNYTGNIVGNSCAGINAYAAGGTVNATGTFTAGAVAAILSSSSSVIRVSGTAINVGDVSPFYCKKLRLHTTQTLSWMMQTQVVGTNRYLYTPGVPLGNPAVTNVKSGVVYGPSSELTGTAVIPDPSNVRKDIPVGDTVGTANLTAADFWNTQTSTLTVSGSIGERLKNASTVDTTGSQLAAQ